MGRIYPGSSDVLQEPFLDIDLDEAAVLVVNRGALMVGWFLHNASAGTRFIKLYNAAAATDVTVGTTTPLMNLPVPAGASANILGKFKIPFTLGIVAAATTDVDGNGAPAGNDVVVNLFYH